MEELVLEHFPKLNEIDFENPQQLRTLSLKKLPKLSNLVRYKDGNVSMICRLSPSMSEIFHSLKQLHIIDCKMEDRRDVHTPANGIVLSNGKVSLFSFFFFFNFPYTMFLKGVTVKMDKSQQKL